jgi:hypothetical protein
MRWSTIFIATCSLLALGASSSPMEVKDIKVLLTTATGGSDKTFKWVQVLTLALALPLSPDLNLAVDMPNDER